MFKINMLLEKVEREGFLDYYIDIDFDENTEDASVCVETKDNKITQMDLLEGGILSDDWRLDIQEESEIKSFMEQETGIKFEWSSWNNRK